MLSTWTKFGADKDLLWDLNGIDNWPGVANGSDEGILSLYVWLAQGHVSIYQ